MDKIQDLFSDELRKLRLMEEVVSAAREMDRVMHIILEEDEEFIEKVLDTIEAYLVIQIIEE